MLASSQTTQVIFTVTSPGGTLTLNVPTLNTSPSNWAGTFGWQRAESIVTELVLADVKGGAQGSGPPDGILDLVAARGGSYHTDSSGTTYFPGRAPVAINSGNGIDFVDGSPPGLPLQSSTPLDCNAMCISVVDVDGQHGPDLFLGVMGTLGPGGAIIAGQNRLFVNRPVGWQEASGAFPNTLVTSVLRSRPIDFDGDAIPDFAIVSGVDTRVLVGSAAGIWTSGAQVLVPPHTRSLAHDLATADFDHDGIPDLLDPSGAFWTGSAAGLVSNNVVVTNQIVTLLSHPGVPFGMRGAVADYDLDGDMDWAGVSISPAGQPQFEIWANVTRQLDFDVISQSNTLVISASTLPLATQFWCYDRSPVPQTVYVLPFLAADLGPLPVRIPVQPFEGLVGLDPSTAVSIGGVTGLVLQNANPGELQRDYVPLTFPASIPLGSIIFYQALNIRITGAATGGAFTNVLRVSIEP